MSYQTVLEKGLILSDLVEEINEKHDHPSKQLINCYVDQNLKLMNEVLALNIAHVKKLNKALTPNELLCSQAKFTHEISKVLSMTAKQFLDASLNNVTDYNEWLKSRTKVET